MGKILLINPYEPPSKRKSAASGTAQKRKKSVTSGASKMATARKKRRTPAQIAATRRMVAANKARRTARKVVRRKKNPVALTKASAYRGVATMQPNPIRRRRRKSASTAKRASSSAARRFAPRRRKNPIQPTMEILQNSIGQSLYGAAGAVLVDVAAGFIPVPDMLKTGYPKYLFKGLLSGLAGVAAGYVVDKKTAASITAGGLTVNLYGAMTELVKKSAPGLNLGYYNASLPATRKNLGAYVSGDTRGSGAALQSSAPGGANGLGAYVSGARGHQTGTKLRAIR